jgi:hypothetical protein
MGRNKKKLISSQLMWQPFFNSMRMRIDKRERKNLMRSARTSALTKMEKITRKWRFLKTTAMTLKPL